MPKVVVGGRTVVRMRLGDRVPRPLAGRLSAVRLRTRRPTPATAFVLSGGGVLGAAQVGQLTALLERGIAPNLVIGTSVGALNGAMIAAEPTLDGVDALRSIWKRLRSDELFPGSRFTRAWYAVSRGDHIYPNSGLRRLLTRLPIATFEEAAVALQVGAMNLRNGEERWFSAGPIAPAILASSALPGIFPPVTIGGERYVDGGVVNNVPVSRAVELGAKRVYVLNCTAGHRAGRPIRRPLDVLVQAFQHSRAARAAVEIERHQGRADIVSLPTFDPGFVRYDDASQTERLIGQALDLTRRFLDGDQALEA